MGKITKKKRVRVRLRLKIKMILFKILNIASRNLTDFWLSYWTQHHQTMLINASSLHKITSVFLFQVIH